jgi:hypothetical protein
MLVLGGEEYRGNDLPAEVLKSIGRMGERVDKCRENG